MRRMILLLVWVLPCWTMARQAPPADSSHTTSTDSATVASERVSSTALSLSLTPPFSRVVSFAEQNRYFFEEFAELFESWPGGQKIKLGDVGYPTYLALAGLPSRLTRLDFDHISWPEGIYGQINLTVLPETFADWIGLDPLHARLQFYSDARPVNTTWTYFEYVDGPFGSDALRVRFRRPLSQRLRTSWSATFANAEPYLPTTIGTEADFNAQKYYGRFEYDLSKKRGWLLQHRFIKTVTERGAVGPVVFEEWPITLQARQKEYRLSHQIDLVKRGPQTDRLLERPVASWRLGLFFWDVRQEFRDDGRSSLYQHRRHFWGVRAQARLGKKAWQARIDARWQTIDFDSSSIRENRQQDGRLRLTGRWLLHDHWRLQGQLEAMYRTRFGAATNAGVELVLQLRPSLASVLALQRRTIFPEVGEYANYIPGVLAANFDLQPLRFSGFQWRVRGSMKTLEFQTALSYYSISQAFTLAWADSLFRMRNASTAVRYPAAEVFLSWRVLRRANLRLWLVRQFHDMIDSYLYWYLPQSFMRTEAEARFVLFGGDLPGAGVLRASYYGPRVVPQPEISTAAVQTHRIGGFWQVDAALRLHFRDAIIFLNLDNVLDQQANWRDRQPIRGRTFRLGINWLLLD